MDMQGCNATQLPVHFLLQVCSLSAGVKHPMSFCSSAEAHALQQVKQTPGELVLMRHRTALLPCSFAAQQEE